MFVKAAVKRANEEKERSHVSALTALRGERDAVKAELDRLTAAQKCVGATVVGGPPS